MNRVATDLPAHLKGVGEPALAVVAATAQRAAFTARPLAASVANLCEQAGMGVTVGCGGFAGSAP
jgi:hypothetical protein